MFAWRGDLAMQPLCESCGEPFEPDRRVRGQRYCSKPVCQRARRARWQKHKLATDQDYRANQADGQARWRQKHPHYWRGYRKRHPDYVKRNAGLQAERNRRRTSRCSVACPLSQDVIAKMDELTCSKHATSGPCRLVPLSASEIAKMDAITIRAAAIWTCRGRFGQ
jgi:hypothetical protein